MHKNKVFPNIYLIYIKNFTLLKDFSSMSQSIFTKYSCDSIFLLTVFLLKVFSGRTFPCNVCVVNTGMSARMIQ